MKQFTCDIRMYGTAIIEANSEEEAKKILEGLDLEAVHIDRFTTELDTGIQWSDVATIRLEGDEELIAEEDCE